MLAEVSIAPVLVAPSTAPTTAPPLPPTVSDAPITPAHTSPSLELNPAIGIVVIQYRNQAGRIELSIPNQQLLDAYAANPLKAFEQSDSTTV